MIEARAEDFTVTRLSGLPVFEAADRIEHEMLAEAGMASTRPPSRDRRSPTTFHVAVTADGRPLASASSTFGPLAEVPLGLALADVGVEITDMDPLPGPVLELVSLAVERGAAPVPGVAEAVYRSFYQQAKRDGARSLVVGIDPWVFDLLGDQYGIPFQILGPPLVGLGRELLPVGGRIDELEAGIAVHSPEFYAYLQESDDLQPWV